jgi:cytochrome P450
MGNLAAFGRDPLNFLESTAREYGDFVPLRFGPRKVFLLNDPADIEQVLATQSKNFKKTLGYRTPFMRRLFGDGLLTSEGEFWTRQRRLAQPAFHRDRIAGYARTIVELSHGMLARWEPGQLRELHADMVRLTTEVVTRTLFNSDVPPEIEQMNSASASVLEHFTKQWSAWRLIFAFVPTPSGRRFEMVMRRLDRYIGGLIQARRAHGGDSGDLLSMLVLAQDEDGSRMTDKQLRDELTTLMVAGLDTTALALSWAFYLLARHPEAEAQLADEIREALGDRPPNLNALSQLPYAEMVIKETMRLYPPAWIIGRESISACEINGKPIPSRASVVMSQWLKHRDPRYFEQPDQFRPERWAEPRAIPKFAYFPFGGGPRTCIGNSFAMMEAVLVLVTVAQRYRFRPGSKDPVLPWPSITLQPRSGITLQVLARDQVWAQSSAPGNHPYS